MYLVRGSGFHSLQREVEGGADLQKVYQVPLEQTSAAGLLSSVRLRYPKPSWKLTLWFLWKYDISRWIPTFWQYRASSLGLAHPDTKGGMLNKM